MGERHFAFFRQGSGECVREWRGPVPEPDVDPALAGDGRLMALNTWATEVSEPHEGEIGLDVTHLGWPVGDLCYCRFDDVDRVLDWGPSRQFIEVDMSTLRVVANVTTHRPLRSTVPGQQVFDITGSPMAAYHGSVFGRFVWVGDRWCFDPSESDGVPETVRPALAETPVGEWFGAFVDEKEYAPHARRRSA